MGKEITLTREELSEMLRESAANAAAATVAALKAVTPDPVGPTAKIVAEIEAAERNRKPQKIQLIPHRSRTGATMKLRVVESKEFPNGRIVGLEDYTRPEGWDKTRAEGGKSSLPMRDPKTGRAVAMASQKDWQRHWQADINTYIGQEYEPRFANVENVAAAE